MISNYVFGIIGFILGCFVNLVFIVNESLEGELLYRSDLHSTEVLCESYLPRNEYCSLTWISDRYLKDH